MKITSILRLLSICGILLFIAPFYESCTFNKRAEEAPADTPNYLTDLETAPITNSEVSSKEKTEAETKDIELKKNLLEMAYDKIDDSENENLLELTKISFDVLIEDLSNFKKFKDEFKNEFTKSDLMKKVGIISYQIRLIIYPNLVLLTLLTLFLLFLNRWKHLNLIVKTNLILSVISLILVFFDVFLKDISRIKWGYYAYILLLIIQLYFLNLHKKRFDFFKLKKPFFYQL